jgi:hypothetical protein
MNAPQDCCVAAQTMQNLEIAANAIVAKGRSIIIAVNFILCWSVPGEEALHISHQVCRC